MEPTITYNLILSYTCSKEQRKKEEKNMEETLQLIQSFGGLVILSGLFVWQWIEEKKESKEEKSNNQKILKELANSNQNIAESKIV